MCVSVWYMHIFVFISVYLSESLYVCLCVRNGHMIIHSHETIEESVSYYGKISQSHTLPPSFICVHFIMWYAYGTKHHLCSAHF